MGEGIGGAAGGGAGGEGMGGAADGGAGGEGIARSGQWEGRRGEEGVGVELAMALRLAEKGMVSFFEFPDGRLRGAMAKAQRLVSKGKHKAGEKHVRLQCAYQPLLLPSRIGDACAPVDSALTTLYCYSTKWRLLRILLQRATCNVCTTS